MTTPSARGSLRPALTIRSRQSRGLRRGDGGRHALLCQQVRNVLRHVCTIPLADSLMMRSGATFATLMGAGATVLVFKLSELATTYKRLSRAEIALFVGASLASFVASIALLMQLTVATWYASH